MNEFSIHLGDWKKHTENLSRIERDIYLSLIMEYYDKEHPLRLDVDRLMRLQGIRSDEEKDAFQFIISEFFYVTDNGYENDYLAARLQAIYEKSDAALLNQLSRWLKEYGPKGKHEDRIKFDDKIQELSDLHTKAIRSYNDGNSKLYERIENLYDRYTIAILPITHNPLPITQETASAAGDEFAIPEKLPDELLDIGFQAIANISPIAYEIEFPLEWDRFRTHKSSADIPDCIGLTKAWLKWMTHPATCERLDIK